MSPKILAPFFSFEAQKSIGNVLTARQRGRDQLITRKATLVDPNTIAQHQARFKYTWYSRVWHFMTTPQRALYSPPAHMPHIAPYNYFMHLMLANTFSLLFYVPLDGLLVRRSYDNYTRSDVGLCYGVQSVQAVVDRGYWFDGVDDFGFISPGTSNPTQFSIAFWCRPHDHTNTGHILGIHGWPAETDPYWFWNEGNVMRCRFATDLGTANYDIATDDTYHHWMMVYDSPSLKYYKDNVEVVSVARPNNMLSCTHPHRLARSYHAANFWWKGTLDQIICALRPWTEYERQMLFGERKSIYQELAQ